jgi:hypothetical protein
MMPVKPQLSKFQADKTLPSAWLQRVMAALAFVKRVTSSVHVSVLSVSICTATVHIGGEVITVSISFTVMSGIENI